jgi:hypothetical protein
MEKVYESLSRHGNLGLSMMAFAGLTLLAAFLWDVAPGYVALLLIPALMVSFYQMVVTPIYGLRMDANRWMVMADEGDTVVCSEDIAHLRVEDRGPSPHVTIVLRNGHEMVVPLAKGANRLDLIRAATERGIPVRSA